MLNQEQQIFNEIKKANNILICFSKNWNPDAVASALALFAFLKKMEKKVEISADFQMQSDVNLQNSGKLFSFLPNFSEVQTSIEGLSKFIVSVNISNARIAKVKYQISGNRLDFIVTPEEGFLTHNDVSSSTGGFKYDLIITLGTPDLPALGELFEKNSEFFHKTSIINIDHQSTNEEYGQINFIELTALSVSEILFSLFESYSRELINEDIATCLLAGIIYKTRSFKTPNITPSILLTTSHLVSMGARREDIVNRLYRSRNINVLKIWGRVLARLSGIMGNSLVWSTLSKLDFEKTNSSQKDIGDIVDELIANIPEARVVVIVHENMNGTAGCSALIYAIKNLSALELASDFSPHGDKKTAQINIDLPIKEAERKIISAIKEKMEKIDA